MDMEHRICYDRRSVALNYLAQGTVLGGTTSFHALVRHMSGMRNISYLAGTGNSIYPLDVSKHHLSLDAPFR